MIDPPISSPVRIDTMPAASRISESGSSKRRNTARNGLTALAGASLLGPYLSSRRTASSVLSPCGPQASVAQISRGVSFQKLF